MIVEGLKVAQKLSGIPRRHAANPAIPKHGFIQHRGIFAQAGVCLLTGEVKGNSQLRIGIGFENPFAIPPFLKRTVPLCPSRLPT